MSLDPNLSLLRRAELSRRDEENKQRELYFDWFKNSLINNFGYTNEQLTNDKFIITTDKQGKARFRFIAEPDLILAFQGGGMYIDHLDGIRLEDSWKTSVHNLKNLAEIVQRIRKEKVEKENRSLWSRFFHFLTDGDDD